MDNMIVLDKPRLEITFYANGIMIETQEQRLRHFAGFYSWDWVPKCVAVFKYLLEVNARLRTVDRCLQEAGVFGLTADDLDGIFGRDATGGAIILQRLIEMARYCPDTDLVWELDEINRLCEGNLEQHVAKLLN